MTDELDLNASQPEAPESVDIATKATTELARGRILLEAQINKLMNSLDKRKNQAFDPVWLRAAQGFLAPTKTGRFGESLGNVAGGVAEEQAKQQALDEQSDKMKLELQQKMYEMQTDAAGSDMMRQAISGQLGPKAQQVAQIPNAQPSAPIGGAQPIQPPVPTAPVVATPVQASPTGTQSVTPEQALQVAVTNPSALEKITMTPDMVQMFYSLPGAAGKKYGDMADKIFNNQRQLAELGLKETDTRLKQRELDTKQIPVASPFDPDRQMQMPTSKYNEFLNLDFSDNKKVNAWLRKNGLAAYAIGKESEPSLSSSTGVTGSNAPTGGTKLENETNADILKEREKSKINEDIKQRTALQDKADASMEVQNSARTIYSYASNPKTSNTFGILAKPGVGPAILTAIENGITVGNYSVGISALPDIIRKAGGTQAEIDAALAVAPKLAQLELGYRSMFLKGQGSVSDMEGKVVAKLGPTLADSPKVVMLKSEMITARATFDNENANRYQEWAKSHPNGYVEQYKHSAPYLELQQHYNNKMKQLDKKYLPD